jgi:hypothetical protein
MRPLPPKPVAGEIDFDASLRMCPRLRRDSSGVAAACKRALR